MLPVCLCRLITQLLCHAVASVGTSRSCLSVETEDTLPLAEKVRALTGPSALLAAAPKGVATTAVPVVLQPQEASERSYEDMGFGL